MPSYDPKPDSRSADDTRPLYQLRYLVEMLERQDQDARPASGAEQNDHRKIMS